MDLNTQNSRNPEIGKKSDEEKTNFLLRILRMLSIREKTETVTKRMTNEDREIIDGLKCTRGEWISANMNFEFAKEQNMIDYFTYRIKACEVRYEYLLRKAKERGLRVDLIENQSTNIEKTEANYL